MPARIKNLDVQKKNLLNELRTQNMTIQELRFFNMYLNKINEDDLEIGTVRFRVEDFKAILELGRVDIERIKTVTDRLLSKVIKMTQGHGGRVGFQLFKSCTLDQDDNGVWYIDIDAHDKALPLMLDYKNRYLKYELWNALHLRSVNQLRMYEILKQFEGLGHRILRVDRLKHLLGVSIHEYARFSDFKRRVLDACRHALKMHTDIQFDYMPYERKGIGGKIHSLKFIIKRNESQENLLRSQSIHDNGEEERLAFLGDAFDEEFSHDEVCLLLVKLYQHNPRIARDDMKAFHCFYNSYNEMNRQSQGHRINDRFNCLKSLLAIAI